LQDVVDLSEEVLDHLRCAYIASDVDHFLHLVNRNLPVLISLLEEDQQLRDTCETDEVEQRVESDGRERIDDGNHVAGKSGLINPANPLVIPSRQHLGQQLLNSPNFLPIYDVLPVHLGHQTVQLAALGSLVETQGTHHLMLLRPNISYEDKGNGLTDQLYFVLLVFYKGLHTRGRQVLRTCLYVLPLQEIVTRVHNLNPSAVSVRHSLEISHIDQMTIDCIRAIQVLSRDYPLAYS
jgi:hypothetical protein